MQPLFTIHAGEYLVGSHIEQNLVDPNGGKVNIWVPSKDTGVDILVTDQLNKKTSSIQVKFSKDFLVTHIRSEYHSNLISCGWWTLNKEKISNSNAEYWIFVMHTFNQKNMQYVILTPQELIKRLNTVHKENKSPNIYLWVSKNGKCWETRGLRKKATDELVIDNKVAPKNRDYSQYLNNWNMIFSKWT